MIFKIYGKALGVIAKKPFKLWGVSLFYSFITFMVTILFGAVLGLSLAINLAISTAMTVIFLNGYRGYEPKTVDLFVFFNDFKTLKRVVCGMVWMNLWLILWGLIPVVGPVFAVIKGYSWRFTPYILAYESEVSPTQAIKESEKRTYGHRLKMFGADALIYAGIFTTVFVLSLLGMIPYVGIIFILTAVIFSLAVTVFAPLFMGLVQAAFYDEINKKDKDE